MATKKRRPNTTDDGELACGRGEPWLGPHPLCRAAVAAVCGVPVKVQQLGSQKAVAEAIGCHHIIVSEALSGIHPISPRMCELVGVACEGRYRTTRRYYRANR